MGIQSKLFGISLYTIILLKSWKKEFSHHFYSLKGVYLCHQVFYRNLEMLEDLHIL